MLVKRTQGNNAQAPEQIPYNGHFFPTTKPLGDNPDPKPEPEPEDNVN